MKRLLGLLVLLAVALLVTASSAAPPPQPNPTLAQLRQKIQNLRNDKADLQDQIDTQDSVIGDQNDTITRLRYRLANQPDPLDVITSRGPDGLWSAMVAIWQAFPRLDPSDICGYDKSQSPGDDTGLTLTTFTFSRWTGC